MNKIVPAILVKDASALEEEIRKVEGFVQKVQIDIIDGEFAQTETIIPETLSEIETNLEFEAHLMVEEPTEWVERCVTAGITAIYGQVEKMSDKQSFIEAVVEAGLKVGLAFDLNTPLAGLEDWVGLVDGVLLLSVPAGAQGQDFDEKVLKKIKEVRNIAPEILIVIDGGLNEENIEKCKGVGGEKMEFAVGSEILNSGDAESSYRKLETIS